MSLDGAIAERLAAATLPAPDPSALSHTGSGVRIRMGEGTSARRRGVVLLAGGMLTVLGLGGALLWVRGAAPSSAGVVAPAQTGVPPPPGPMVVAPAPQVRPSTFRVVLRVTPRDARIELDGRFVGVGQFSEELLRDGREHALRVSAAGYASRTLRFRDEGPADAELSLEPVQIEAPEVEAPHLASPPRAEKRPRARAKGQSKRAEEPLEPSAPSLDIQLSR
jgi:hypothetical protein